MNDERETETVYGPRGITPERRANGMTDFGMPLATFWDPSAAGPEDQVAQLWVYMMKLGDRYERRFTVGQAVWDKTNKRVAVVVGTRPGPHSPGDMVVAHVARDRATGKERVFEDHRREADFEPLLTRENPRETVKH